MPDSRFDLWQEPWIGVEAGSGVQTVPLYDALANAHQYRAIHEQFPLMVAGNLRFLIAIAQAIFAPGSEKDLKHLLSAGKFPRDRIDAFCQQYGHRFDLFSPEAPFYQAVDLPADLPEKPVSGTSSIARLTPDTPSGDYTTFRKPGHESQNFYCPACATKALLILPAFATTGGPGFRPSICGIPPIYTFPEGKNLFESLALSLTLPEYQPEMRDAVDDLAWWVRESVVSKGQETKESGYLHSLTFVPRRVRLYPEAGFQPCTRCGTRFDIGIRWIHFEPGEYRSKTAPLWMDPFVAYRPSKGRAIQPRRGGIPMRELPLLLTVSDENLLRRPRIVDQVVDLQLPVRGFRFIGVSTDNAKYIDVSENYIALDEYGLLRSPGAREALGYADKAINAVRPALKSVSAQSADDIYNAAWGRLIGPVRELISSGFSHAGQLAWVNAVTKAVSSTFYALARGHAPWPILANADSFCANILRKKRKQYLESLGIPDEDPVDENNETQIERQEKLLADAADLTKRLEKITPEVRGILARHVGGKWSKELDKLEIFADLQKRDVFAFTVVATLQAALKFEQKDGAGDVGEALHPLARKSGTEDRMISLLDAGREELPGRLYVSLSQLDRYAGFDWNQLFIDIRFWNVQNNPVQRRWARKFFSTTTKKKRSK